MEHPIPEETQSKARESGPKAQGQVTAAAATGQLSPPIPPHIQAAPWNRPGARATMLLDVTRYVHDQLGREVYWNASAEEWHAMLLDAYNEMVSLGLLLPEEDV